MRTAFGAGFDIDGGYLNTPSVGIPPVVVADAVARGVARWRTGADNAPAFDEHVETARQGFADLLGVPADRVASGASASQLVASVAAALPPGSRVLVAEGDFTSVTFPFAARGCEVTEVPLAALPGRVSGHDLVAVSVVQSADGAIVDLAALREACAAEGVPVLLDATQAAGWLPARLDWADWVVAAGYKWLLSPRGTAWLAVHPRVLERTVPVAANWFAGQRRWESIYGLPLRLAADARRFDLSPAWLAQIGAAVALPYLAGLGVQAVHRHGAGLANLLRSELGLEPGDSVIVSLPHPGAPAALTAAGISHGVRAGRARLGFHLYNTAADVEQVLDALRGELR
ncbi:aminotransferase class V-fold PLP-dependent enzyme [Amycolatopsis suaedae]|uniref:Aminotransferase class V-fold PLP-dependent enzyme n=1 Tax=Amycolatopsis suaedae TaxID=2510978 RepID=A0A4V2EKZ3_9PSEU|nr:aminotransferase class V-fold PLP-dependent enzyme [Amycolatopsis suaedae]RZQ59765.1 aminotransferase class V-fold PLP-dependent enzyme [Amycolatopsis suaedae]